MTPRRPSHTGLDFMRVQIEEIDAKGLAHCVTEIGKQLAVPVNIRRAKGALPAVGDQWIIDRSIGNRWSFAAIINPSLPTIEGERDANPALGALLGALDDAGLVDDQTTEGTPPGGGVTDHGALSGLGDDDHTQYLTEGRGDARYDPLGAADGKASSTDTRFPPTPGALPDDDFVVTESGLYVAKTTAQVKAILGLGSAAYTASGTYATASHQHGASDINSGTLDIARIPTGTTSTTVPLGNDSRFSDARTPTAHASTHAIGGADPIPELSAVFKRFYTSNAHYSGRPSEISPGTFTMTPVSGRYIAWKVVFMEDVSVIGVKTLVRTTGGAGAKLNIGIYASSGGKPNGACLWSPTTPIDATVAGSTYVNSSGSSVALTGGVTYFGVGVMNDTTMRMQHVDSTVSGQVWPLGVDTDTNAPMVMIWNDSYNASMPTLTAANFSLATASSGPALWALWKIA